MASTEDQSERQARIEADIRRLFARYRQVGRTESTPSLPAGKVVRQTRLPANRFSHQVAPPQPDTAEHATPPPG
jgi:hypothetical protein